MSISLKGFDEKVVTFEAETGVKAGDLVKVSGNGKVDTCNNGDVFCGVVIAVRDGYASVQVGGYVNVNCDNTISSVGYKNLVSDASGKVKVLNDTYAVSGSDVTVTKGGRSLLVVDVDSTSSTAGIIL